MARKRVSRKKREKNARVSEKIELLEREGKSPKVAQGEAFGMERSGRLRRHGVYKHVRKSKRKGHR